MNLSEFLAIGPGVGSYFRVKSQSAIAQEVKAGKDRRDVDLLVNITGRDLNEGVTDKRIESFIVEVLSSAHLDENRCRDLNVTLMNLQKAGYEPSPAITARVIEIHEVAKKNYSKSNDKNNKQHEALITNTCENFLANSSWEKIAKEVVEFDNTARNRKTTLSQALTNLQWIQDKQDRGEIKSTPTQKKSYFDYNTIKDPGEIKLFQKSKDEIEKEKGLYHAYHNYGAKVCPFYIVKSDGSHCDIWNIPVGKFLDASLRTLATGKKGEINKLRIMCEHLDEKSFNPTYEQVAMLAKINHDFSAMGKQDPNITKILNSLKYLAQDKFNQAYNIAQYKCRMLNRNASLDDTLRILGELDAMEKAKASTKANAKANSNNGGYNGGM